MQPTILSLQQQDNLAVIQFSTKPSDTIEYISMGNAMKAGFIFCLLSNKFLKMLLSLSFLEKRKQPPLTEASRAGKKFKSE